MIHPMAKAYADNVNEILDDGGTVKVWFARHHPGVVLPEHLRADKRPVEVLDICKFFAVPIRDLCVDEDGISGTFSFNRSPHLVIVPWDAVVQIMDAKAVPTLPPQPATAKLKAPRKVLPPGWCVIEGGKSDKGAA